MIANKVLMPPSDMIVRAADPADALCIAVLGMQVFLDTYATEGIRDSIAREVLEAFSPDTISKSLALPDTSVLVAEINNHLAGFAQTTLRTPHELIVTPDAAELKRLYVQERFTGLGIGSRLLHEAEKHAALGGASVLWATVWARNERALGFYPCQGYVHTGTVSHAFQNETHGNQLFSKRLSSFP